MFEDMTVEWRDDHNHGYLTVDPLKPDVVAAFPLGEDHNHGSQTVDPLKLGKDDRQAKQRDGITTVTEPWTH